MASLIPKRFRRSPRSQSFFTASSYITRYVDQVYDHILRGQVVLLVAPLGSGKSEVLGQVKSRIDAVRGLKAVPIDMGRNDAPRTASDFWREVLLITQPGTEIAALGDPAAISYLRDRATRGQDHTILLIDQAELVDEDWLFEELRAAVVRSEDGGRGLMTVVVASTEAMSYRLFGITSPFQGISHKVVMEDCSPAVRRDFWNEYLKALPGADRDDCVNALDQLCAGDPYQIEAVSNFIVQQAHGNPLGFDVIADAIRASRTNPARVAPLLRRYGELVEADPVAFQLALRLIASDTGEPADAPNEAALENAAFWRGVFANDGSAWRFRSELTERFFRQEFRNHPERVAAAHVRHGAYAEAVLVLAPRRDRFRNGQDALVATIAAWIKAAASPSQAWQNAANALSLCFGPNTRVLRYAPFRQLRTDPDVHFYQVRPGELESPVGAELSGVLHLAHDERIDAHPRDDLCMRPARDQWRDSDGNDTILFPLSHESHPYGAIMFSRMSFDSPNPTDWHSQRDHEDRWQKALSSVFREIVGFEAQALGGADLSRAQREAQAGLARGEDGPATAQWLVLTTITGGFGLRFNRAVLLRAIGAGRLEGVEAIGYHTQADQEWAWKGAPLSLDRTLALLKPTAAGGPPVEVLTPMSKEVREFSLSDWQTDPLLGLALRDGNITLVNASRLEEGRLGQLMRLEDGLVRQAKTAFVVPLRHGERLLGVLILDKPFADEPVTQEQFDALPSLAFQLGLSLRSTEDAEQRSMFDEISALGTEALSYQEAAERLAVIVLKTMKVSISQMVISTWESAAGRNSLDRRQVTVRVVMDANGRNLIAGRPIFAYYRQSDQFWGPAHEALRAGVVDIPDWSAWRVEHDHAPTADYDADVRAIFSLPMGDRMLAAPRAVVSFQTTSMAGFNLRDRGLFTRIAERAGNILDKARQYESLERGRYLTDQLNESLTRLVEPVTDEALYRALLDQLRAFFKLDAYDWRQERYPNSAALIALSDGRPQNVVAGSAPALALELARACHRIREAALSNRTAYVEYADRELLAREQFGAADCADHHAAGAEASVWCAIGDGLLLVMAWATPRRISSAERRNLPLLAVIAERTSVLINAERQRLVGQLANSLRIEDYELIEAEQTHQWNRRMRAIHDNAHWAIESLTRVVDVPEAADALKHLDDLDKEATEAQNRLIYGRFKHIDKLSVGTWVNNVVRDWLSMHRDVDSVSCRIDDGADRDISTRPVVLRWILYELLSNAEAAEKRSSAPHILIEVGSDPMSQETTISIENGAPLPAVTLEALARKTPPPSTLSDSGRGRGLWIIVRQVPALLGGMLELPKPGASTARITLRLPNMLVD